MTRVILTNKKTGQELPEAELGAVGGGSIEVRFDGTHWTNTFAAINWEYREVRQFRNGDVLRRKDRGDFSGFYVYTESGWGFVNWNEQGPTLIPRDEPIGCLESPEWEVV